jgi:uncharacterized protein (DUF4415 family)
MGRPPTGRPIKRPINVMLDERIADALRTYGDDNLSAGVARAAAAAAERGGTAPPTALPDVREAMAGSGAQAKSSAKASGRGRPLAGVRPRVRTNLHLYPELVEQLRAFGDGVVSRGIERAALFVRAVRL